MKVLFVLILLSISLRGISQDIPEFKIEEEYTWTNGSTPKVLNLKEIKAQTIYPDSAKINYMFWDLFLHSSKNNPVRGRLEVAEEKLISSSFQTPFMHSYWTEITL